jgi:N-acetylneuraminate epimerase
MSCIAKSFSAAFMLFTLTTYAQKIHKGIMQWKIAAQLPATGGQSKALGVAGPVTGIDHDALIVAGGSNFPDGLPWQNGKKQYYDEIHVYLKKGGQIKVNEKTFRLPVAIAYAAVCSTKFGVVYAGGENENGISDKVISLQWDSHLENIIVRHLPDLPLPLTNAAVAVSDNIVYLAGGETSTGVSANFFSLDLDSLSAGWKQLPVLPRPVSHTVMAIQSNGRFAGIYLLGGRRKNNNGISDLYKSVYEFDPGQDKWSEKAPLPYTLCAGTGIATGSGYILLFGGDTGERLHKVQTAMAGINAEADPGKKRAMIEEKNKLQSTHPGFSKKVLMYNTIADSWSTIGSIPFDAPVTTTACKWDGEVIIPCGEIRAGVRTPEILSCRLPYR